MAEPEINASKERYRMLDLLRGVTVFFMIAAHAVYFFHNDTNNFLRLVETFGNTIAFTTFLIVSAATAEVAYYSKEDKWPESKKRLIKRVMILALGYYLLAFAVFFAQIFSTHGLAKLNLIANILFLRNLASYAEFFIPFIVFPLIISAAPRIFRKITKNIYLTLIIGFAVYFMGMFYYKLPIYDFLIPWKALLFGSEGYYRFPIFQYFPLYLLGMAWGRQLLEKRNLKHQKEIAEASAFISALAFGVFAFAIYFSGGKLDLLMKRWPPSISFLLIGIFFVSVLSFILYFTNQLKKIVLLRDSLLVLGQNALGLALTHIFLLQIYTLAGGLRTGSIALYLVSFIILMILSLAIAAIIPFNFRFTLNLERGRCTEHDLEEEALVRLDEEIIEDIEKDVVKLERYFFIGPYKKYGAEKLVKKRHIIGISLLVGLTALITISPVAEQYQIQKSESQEITWSNTDYGWREKIMIKNNENLAEIPKGGIVQFQFNYSDLVKSKKIYPDAHDLIVQYWDGKNFRSLNYWLTADSNQKSAAISIELQERLKPGDTTKKYYIYYGNNLAKSNASQTIKPQATNLNYTTELTSEESYSLLLTVDRRWSILSDDPKISDSFRISLQSSSDYPTENAKFEISGTKISGELTKTAEKLWEGVISTKDLDPGEYYVTAKIENDGNTINSSRTGFYVSYPLYVAWTQDWEGYDVSDTYLNAITQIANEHELVMTHFWNPRLTATDTVSQNRKDALLSWVKNRKENFGESIQMHLHMFTDFITASGVTPIYSPNWGDSGDGYGTLTTNYGVEDMTKIIKKGIEIMRQSGLSAPTIFRAGGWFANLNTLQAEENNGILADSSGRTAYKFFSQTGPWSLSQTAQPYYPSTSDQNKSGSSSLSILEIPNNGADSYWFTSEEMKNRFRANYPGGILTEPKQVTYLSHPHWFNKAEQTKIEEVFNLVDEYKYSNDAGPAIYVTLDEIYKVWSEK